MPSLPLSDPNARRYISRSDKNFTGLNQTHQFVFQAQIIFCIGSVNYHDVPTSSVSLSMYQDTQHLRGLDVPLR